MRGELGEDWQYRFSSFNEEASAAASLGQVHKAVSREGRELACKLQYPDMASAIDTDLRQLKTIFSIYEKYDNAIYTRYIHEELQERLFEEIDYFLEARHCRLFRYMLGKEKNVSVPEVEENLSTQRLLTTEWLEGTPVLSYTDAPAEQRNRIALNMFRAWYVPFYYYGAIHGDPHLGNYSVNDDDSINLLDFGCVRTFRPEFVGGVIDLYNALLENDVDLAAHAYETWGFTGLSRDQIDILNIWARFLYAPLLEDGVRPIGLVTEGVYGRETAAEVHRKLREYGRVSVPREFVFMDRAALGLGSVFLHLKAEINWHRLFNEMIEDFDIEAMRLRQNETFSKFEISPPD
jgi:predicted unusual protein kinase regulating ubiquinone biosynthesis (AarF/ABC1/UbiB family)